VVVAKRQGEEDDRVEVGQDKSEVVMKNPWDSRVMPHPEHLLHSIDSTAHQLPILSISFVLSAINQLREEFEKGLVRGKHPFS
jgi:hypothetical protein